MGKLVGARKDMHGSDNYRVQHLPTVSVPTDSDMLAFLLLTDA